jgi:hypothetical protein
MVDVMQRAPGTAPRTDLDVIRDLVEANQPPTLTQLSTLSELVMGKILVGVLDCQPGTDARGEVLLNEKGDVAYWDGIPIQHAGQGANLLSVCAKVFKDLDLAKLEDLIRGLNPEQISDLKADLQAKAREAKGLKSA